MERIAPALAALREGKLIVVTDDESRENEGDFILAAEKATPEAVHTMARLGRGLICAPVAGEAAERLHLPPMVVDNREYTGCAFTVSVDAARGVGSGISAHDRATTLRELARADARADDFVRPGHVFPLRAKEGGVLVRAGHTEASVDLCRMAGLAPAAAICEILAEDGDMLRGEALTAFCAEHGFPLLTIEELIAVRHRTEKLVYRKREETMRTLFGEFRVVTYGVTFAPEEEHTALVYGEVEAGTPLVRVQGEEAFGSLFESVLPESARLKERAMQRIVAAGSGALIIIRHTGKDAGKDRKEYGLGAQILADLGLTRICLLTAHQKKLLGVKAFGIEVVQETHF